MKRLALALLLASCGGKQSLPAASCSGVTCSGHGACAVSGNAAQCICDAGYLAQGATACVASGASGAPSIAGCAILPPNHVFNTRIDALPAHPDSDAFIATIGGTRHLHLDLGTTTDPQSATYYGIPYNVVHGSSLAWAAVSFSSTDPSMSWDPRAESDCATADHRIQAPCTAPSPVLPIPAAPLVEGGIDPTPSQPYGDHHTLLLDADNCRLWETYHTYPHQGGPGWDIFGAATWDLKSNALRPDGWTSCDAAGFPILPLLLRADEASSGAIRHALRFTIQSQKIRTSYVWPARHLTTNGTSSASLPQMGQLFRLKASFVIPAGSSAQTQAILGAMQTYGMYIADGGSDMFVQGEPSAAWQDATFSQVQAVPTSAFEAVDISSITSRAGFDANSAAVPP